jgi:transcription-repair coupling factor (superfamily II helicase)
VDEVVADLTAPRPMDRLVCGDVGFGKTEVALRAAFLAAAGGRQVAVLAPTTVLVEQHHRSFTDRLGNYPIRVEAVSRFRSRKELAAALSDIAEGRVDIAIGTHRLLSSDVRFKNLGLLIIDEEHRFGVAHKERLKRLRTQVDVLTMTATPIPRTLHMGMIGLRSISIIATPPVDRLAIRTFVCRYDESVVAEAIRKELDRGGQVFFVHNRVQTIGRWAERIGDLIPEARVAVGHGQMDPRRLERVMVDFVAGEYDVLVCTTIIESGLDIPRANTMFVNHADQFGLAQLYQLRGRIGRSRHRAFCYLLVPGFEKMTGDARQRLSALQRFTELGSGFSIASHDLEIRGAGELLGAKQSGQIAAVGFDTYAHILEEAVSELQGEPITRETDPELNTGVAAFIPDDYVEDVGQRLDLYKRLSSAAGDEDRLADLLAEIRDRYGPEPAEVEALAELMVVKGLASTLGATVVDLAEHKLSLTLSDSTPLTPEQVVELVRPRRSPFRLTPQMRLIANLEGRDARSPLTAAKQVLRHLLQTAGGDHASSG